MDYNGKKLHCNGNDKRYIRRPFHSPSYPNPQYKGQDKANVKDRKKPRKTDEMEKLASQLTETLPVLKSLMEGIAADHRRLAEAEERRVAVEERKAEASESIAAALQQLMSAAASGQMPVGVAGRIDDAPPEKPGKQEKERAVRIISDMREEGATYRQIAARLDAENISTFSGKGKWHAQTIHRICQAENL
jgi:hypothetical protein